VLHGATAATTAGRRGAATAATSTAARWPLQLSDINFGLAIAPRRQQLAKRVLANDLYPQPQPMRGIATTMFIWWVIGDADEVGETRPAGYFDAGP
jgi:hypothetical protein